MKTKNIFLLLLMATATLLAVKPSRAIPPRSAASEKLQQAVLGDVEKVADSANGEAREKGERAEQATATEDIAAVTGSKKQTTQASGEYRLAQVAKATDDGALGASTVASGLFENRLHGVVQRGGGRALIIRSSEAEAKEQAALEKDLSIMSHILDKALEENVGQQSQDRKAMGINVYFPPASNPIRSLFLDGYGAVFVMNVGFPVLPPPSKPETAKEESSTDSTDWQEAERELYGRGTEPNAFSGKAEPYDDEKVSKLKDTLLEALKNASNIRGLRSDESVTVCVFGSAAGGTRKIKTSTLSGVTTSRSAAAPRVWIANSGAPSRGSVLTIRVKKSDAEAFAKGKLDLQDFRKKAKIVAYPGEIGSDNPFVFGGDGGSFGYGFAR